MSGRARRTPSAHPNTATTRATHTRAAPDPPRSAGSASRPIRAATPAPADNRSAAPGAPSAGAAAARTLHQAHRPRVTVLVPQDLRQPRRLDRRPLSEQPSQHRLKRIELRPSRCTPTARQLGAPRESSHSPPIHPQSPSDLALRDPVRDQRPHLRPLQRAPHLRTSRSTSPINRASKATRTRSATQQVVHFSITDSGAVLGCAHQPCHINRPVTEWREVMSARRRRGPEISEIPDATPQAWEEHR